MKILFKVGGKLCKSPVWDKQVKLNQENFKDNINEENK